MVVLSAAVMTNPANKSGKVLLARQYVDMTRIRVEGLLAALPRLMTPGQQHTFIETESVRYLYQPFEGMLLVLVTNKGSNIVEDLETLRLMGILLTELVPLGQDMGEGAKRTEVEVVKTAFEIMFAFDELLSTGYRNNVNVDSVLTTLEMKSTQEELANAAALEAINRANKIRKEKEKELKKKRERERRDREEGGGGGGGGGGDHFQDDYRAAAESAPAVEAPSAFEAPAAPAAAAAPAGQRRLGGGMAIGKPKKGKKDTLSAVLDEDNIKAPEVRTPQAGASAGGAGAASGEASAVAAAEVALKEHISCSFDEEGNLLELPKVKGSLSMTIPNKEHGLFEVAFNPTKIDRRNFELRPNPKLDGGVFEREGTLRPKAESKPFNVGQNVPLLKWGLRPGANFEVPLTLSVWGDEDQILVQYELSDSSKTFVNATIRIPVPEGAAGTVDEVDVCHYNAEESCFVWEVPRIDAANPQAGVSITWHDAVNVSDVSPLNIEFQSPSPLSGLDVCDVTPTGPGAEWYRKRPLFLASARRSSPLGKVAQKTPEAIKNISDFL